MTATEEERIKRLEVDMNEVKGTLDVLKADVAENKNVIHRIDHNTLEIVETFKALKWLSFMIKWILVAGASAAGMWAYLTKEHLQ